MKTVIVTGATSGIGFAVCRELLNCGWRVLGVGHSESNCASAKESLLKEFPQGNIEYFCADLMQQQEIKKLSGQLASYLNEKCGGRLEALINNAGCVRSWYSTTQDGYEQQFALNHLAGFLLTHYMLPYLQNAGGRVLMTSSGSHKMMKMHWGDIMYKKGYRPLMAYKQSKLCNMLFAFALNEMFSDIRAYGIDPGLVKTDIGEKQTGGIVKLFWSFRKKSGVSPQIPAKTYAWVCSQEKPPKSLYYYLCGERKYSRQVNKENAEKLFALSENLCGITFGRY